MPDLTAAALGAAGAVLAPVVLRKLFVKKDAAGVLQTPKWMTGNAVYAATAGTGIALGYVVSKFLKKPRMGAALALGAVTVTLAGWVQEQQFYKQLGDTDDYEALDLQGSSDYGSAAGNIGDADDMEALELAGAEDDFQDRTDFAQY
jgi:citrate lyase alpha subunit